MLAYPSSVTTFATNGPANSIVDVIDELEKTMIYMLQNIDAVDGLGPNEPIPLIESPSQNLTGLQFGLGEVVQYEHMTRPYAVWTLGDTRQAGGQHRAVPTPLVNPRPFKKALDMVTCTLYGANLDESDSKRGTIRGCEQLRWCFWWALREHWGGTPVFEREGWIEVGANNQAGYAWSSSFRVPMSQMRPAIPQRSITGPDLSLEFTP